MGTLKTVNILGEDYNYIEKDGKTTVDGFLVMKGETGKLRDYAENVGGMAREMFKPVAEEDVEELLILSYTIKLMVRVVELRFKKVDGSVEIKRGQNDTFLGYVIKSFNDYGIKMHPFNTLEFIKEFIKYNGPQEYKDILGEYYSPTHVNNTGIYIQGKEVKYGERVYIKDVDRFIKNMKVRGKTLEDFKPTSVYIDLNKEGINAFGIVGWMAMERNGKKITCNEVSYMVDEEYDKYTLKEKEYLINNMEKEIAHEVALEQNNHKGKITDKEWLNARYGRMYDQMIEDMKEPYESSVGYDYLNSLIRDNYV